MCMNNNELDRELDKLVEGRMKKLNGINLMANRYGTMQIYTFNLEIL